MAEPRVNPPPAGREPTTVSAGLRAALVAVLAACAAAGFLVDMHPHFEIERLPVFNALLGLAACAVLVAAAGILGALLGRRDDSHDR